MITGRCKKLLTLSCKKVLTVPCKKVKKSLPCDCKITLPRTRSDKLQKEIAERKASLSEAEAAQEAKQTRKELDQIMARISKMEQQTIHVVNPEELTAFFQLMDKAKELAEYCEMNIDIKTSKSLYGVLKLQSGYIMMNQDTDIRIRKIMNELILKSEQFSIAVLEGVFEMEFWFKLFNIVKKEE